MQIQNNMEESLIILKPDALDNKEIIFSIIVELYRNDLKVIDKKKVKLDENRIQALWAKSCQDYVLRELLMKYLDKQVVSVWIIKGKSTTNKLNRIKQCIRAKYSKSYYSNCIHTPSSEEEYKYNLKVLTNKTYHINKIEENIYPFERYCKLEKYELDKCIWKVYFAIKQIDFIKILKNIFEYAAKYKLLCIVIWGNNIQNLSYIVAGLYECFREWDISKAYFSAIALGHLGIFPVEISNDIKKLENVRDKLSKFKIQCEIIDPKHILEEKGVSHSD